MGQSSQYELTADSIMMEETVRVVGSCGCVRRQTTESERSLELEVMWGGFPERCHNCVDDALRTDGGQREGDEANDDGGPASELLLLLQLIAAGREAAEDCAWWVVEGREGK